MKKANFLQLCNYYDVNTRAVQECLNKESLKRKTATTIQVLDVMYLYCTELFYCRSIGDGTVEYLDPKMIMELVTHSTTLREVA